MRTVYSSVVCSILAFGLSAWGCRDTPDVGNVPASVPLQASPVRMEEIAEPILGSGGVAAEKTTEVGPRVDGIIDEIYVKVGDHVEGGQPLFRTRQVDYEISVRRARHALTLARAELRKAERDLHRAQELREQDIVAEDRLDAVRTAHEISGAQSRLAETALEQAEQALTDTVVKAPYTGVITARYIDEGTMQRTMMSASARVVLYVYRSR